MATTPRKTLFKGNVRDRNEGRETGITLKANGGVEMAAAQGVDIWWEDDQIKAGRLQPGASIEEWQLAANLDWLVRRAKVQYYADRAQTDLRTDEENVVLVRSDTGERLGIVSADYQVVQPFEVLEFFRDLVAGQGFELHTAGTLFGGKKYWALAKVTEAVFSGWDKVGGFLLLSSSADGKSATEAQETTICVVCRNTLNRAGREDVANRIRINHRQRFDAASVQKQLGLAEENFAAMCEDINSLTKVKISDAAAEDFVLRLLRPTKETIGMVNAMSPTDSFEALLNRPAKLTVEQEEETVRRPRGADLILELFSGEGMGATQKGRKGTAWGLVNAVTEYVDHHATAKSADHLMDRALWGTGADLKVEAFQGALKQFA